MDICINTSAAELSLARSQSLLAPMTPLPFPVLVVGNVRPLRFIFHDNGTVESWSGSADYSLRVTIADVLSAPEGSTFTLTPGSDQAITCAYDIDATTLATALNASATIAGEGGVDVYEQGTGRFLLAYRAVGAVADIAVDAALLYPDCVAEMTVLTEGAPTRRQLAMLTLHRLSSFQSSSWTAVSTGWSGSIDLTSSAAQQFMRTNGVRIGELLQCTSVLTVEVLDGSGNPTCYYQTPITLRALNHYMVTQILGIGPSYNSQDSDETGTIEITPESQIHTERIVVTGVAGDRDLVVTYPDGLGAGAHIDIIVSFEPGAANGINITIYQNSAESGNELFNFSRDGGETNALFSLVAAGSSTFRQSQQVIPSFPAS